jgi:hypothetical protein
MWETPLETLSVRGLSDRGRLLLLRFVNLSDRSLSHPLAWRRFYGFVRYAHAHRARLMSSDLQLTLESSGFRKADAELLSLIYTHGRGVLGQSTPIFRGDTFYGER